MKIKNRSLLSLMKPWLLIGYVTLSNLSAPLTAESNCFDSKINYAEYPSLTEVQESELAGQIEAYLQNQVPGLSATYRDVINALIAKGKHVYLRGGVIRDLLRSKSSEPRDVDFDYTDNIENLREIVDENQWMYTQMPGSSTMIIGEHRGHPMEGLPANIGFSTGDDLFSVNNIYYHCNTRRFLAGAEIGIHDLSYNRLNLLADNWTIWFSEKNKHRYYKVFRFWKMVGKGYVYSMKMEKFFHQKTLESLERDSEGFFMELFRYLGKHYYSFDEVYRGSIAIMGYDWARKFVHTSREDIEFRYREIEEMRDQYTRYRQDG